MKIIVNSVTDSKAVVSSAAIKRVFSYVVLHFAPKELYFLYIQQYEHKGSEKESKIKSGKATMIMNHKGHK